MPGLMNKYERILSENNYKLTSQRRDILKVLIENREKHFSADRLYQEVQDINSDIGLATIYRNLEIFCELGIVHMLEFESKFKHYELVDFEAEHHHHLICLNCDKILEFSDEDLEEFERRLEKEYSFTTVDHHLKFYGYCNECKTDSPVGDDKNGSK